jgi:putative transposase
MFSGMPRRPRVATGGYVYHVLNRAVGRATIFETVEDYLAFEKVLREANDPIDMRLLALCLMPNHWHLVLWPRKDGDLSEYMRWLTNTHTRRWHLAHGTVGTGPLYQGRFKSFPVEQDEHFYSVCRYAERNALRAGLVAHVEQWRWSSPWLRANQSQAVPLAEWPLPRGKKWVEYLNQAATESELRSLRRSAWSGRPYGETAWVQRTAKRLGLESTLRAPGRPRSTSGCLT